MYKNQDHHRLQSVSLGHGWQPSLRTARVWLVTLRPHQWVKNVVLFGGMLFSDLLGNPVAVALSLSAFFVFCLASSAVYLLNDVNDLQADRDHPQKRLRPIAAGEISVTSARAVMYILAVGAIALGFAIGVGFVRVLLAYFAVNLAYSLKLKHIAFFDVVLIAFGFVLRAVGGAIAVGVEPSIWIILCTLTLALVVAFGKRHHELSVLTNATRHRPCLEHYSLPRLEGTMLASAAAAVVTYTLYTVSPRTVAEFGSRRLIFTVPFVMYGVFRYVSLVHQRRGGDPARLLVRDSPLLVNAGLWVVVVTVLLYIDIPWIL